MESIRQRQVAKTIQVAMSEIVQKDLNTILEGALITISGVRITPGFVYGKNICEYLQPS
jgi:ribosome-binding factor A